MDKKNTKILTLEVFWFHWTRKISFYKEPDAYDMKINEVKSMSIWLWSDAINKIKFYIIYSTYYHKLAN